MITDERKGTVLFCYAVALAARRLDKGDFQGLNCGSFLDHVERLFALGVVEMGDDLSPAARMHGESILYEVRRLLQIHEARPSEGHVLRLVWSRPDDQE